MIMLTNIALLLVAVISGSMKFWEKYYHTLVYVSLCNLLYNFLCQDYLIWSFHPDILLNHKTTDLLNTFVLLPCTTLLYLHFFSYTHKKLFYYLLWVIGYTALEYAWYLKGNISYDHGWNIWWSSGFYCAMFFAIWLHHNNVKKALLFSLAVIVLLVSVFHVPIWKD